MEGLEKCTNCSIFFDPFIWVGFDRVKCPKCGHVFLKAIEHAAG